MKNNIRYKSNINNTSVIIFFNWKTRTRSDVTLLGTISSEFFVMLVVVVVHFIFDLHFTFVSSFHSLIFILLLFFICQCSSFTFAFLTSSLTLPWTIAGFLHPLYTFSPAHRRVICNTFIFNHSIIFLPRALRF